jgi:hypothetical protein
VRANGIRLRWKIVTIPDVLTIAGLMVLAFGAESNWPVYRISTLHASGNCTYGTAAAMSSSLAWTTMLAGLAVAMSGLFVSRHTVRKRALSLAAASAVPFLVLMAAAATNFTGIDKDPQTTPPLAQWWVLASSATGLFFLVVGVGRWALAAALLYLPAIFYGLSLFERHLESELRRI